MRFSMMSVETRSARSGIGAIGRSYQGERCVRGQANGARENWEYRVHTKRKIWGHAEAFFFIRQDILRFGACPDFCVASIFVSCR